MIEDLEHRIVQLYDAGDLRWSCLLADWLILAACLRHKHLERSYPICVTQSTAHFFVPRVNKPIVVGALGGRRQLTFSRAG